MINWLGQRVPGTKDVSDAMAGVAYQAIQWVLKHPESFANNVDDTLTQSRDINGLLNDLAAGKAVLSSPSGGLSSPPTMPYRPYRNT